MSSSLSNHKFLLAFVGAPHRAIDRPFSRGEWTYATDAVIAIRVPRLADVAERESAPEVETLPWPEIPVALALSEILPMLPRREWEPCTECNALGVKGEKGRSDCPECRGTGRQEVEGLFKMPWANVKARTVYLRKMSMFLRGLRIVKAPTQTESPAIQFVFDGGGSGVLMATEKL